MKVIVRRLEGEMLVYIPKKDLEMKVLVRDPEFVFGGMLELEGGMKISLPPMDIVPNLPITLNAKKVN